MITKKKKAYFKCEKNDMLIKITLIVNLDLFSSKSLAFFSVKLKMM